MPLAFPSNPFAPVDHRVIPFQDDAGQSWIADSKGRFSRVSGVELSPLATTFPGDGVAAALAVPLNAPNGLLTLEEAQLAFVSNSTPVFYGDGETYGNFYIVGNLTVEQNVTALSFTGDGADLTNLNLANIAGSGTTGRALLAAETASVARTTLGAGATGDSLFQAATTSTAWEAIGGTGSAASPTFRNTTISTGSTTNLLTLGNQANNSTSSTLTWLAKSGGGTNLSSSWVMRANAFFSLDVYGGTDAIRVDASNGRVAFTRGIEGNTSHNGFLTIGTATVTNEDAGMLVVNRGYSNATGSHHAIRVKSTDSVLAAGEGINFFDAQAIVSSNNNIDHIAEFQARSTKSGTGTMNDWFGYWTSPIFSAGLTTRAAHIHIEDATGPGNLATQYGVRIKPLTKGTTNYAIVTEGAAPCVFGGRVSATIPNYTNDAAADDDAALLSGQLYRTTAGGRTVYQKP